MAPPHKSFDPSPRDESIGRKMAMAVGVNPDNPQKVDEFVVKFARYYEAMEAAEEKAAAKKARPIWLGFTIIGSGLGIVLTGIVAALAPAWVAYFSAHLPGGGAK